MTLPAVRIKSLKIVEFFHRILKKWWHIESKGMDSKSKGKGRVGKKKKEKKERGWKK